MDFLFDGPEAAPTTVLLAHGASAPMDSASLTAMAHALAGAGLRVARFEFAYMAARRSGARRPPPRAEAVVPEYRAAVAALGPRRRLVIGGKSMGGRVASHLVDELFDARTAAGLLCLGYPFHPPGKPEQLRTGHLERLAAPALIVQGTRDPFGTRAEVAAYTLSPAVTLIWLEDGDHDLKPRKTVSGFSAADHLATLGREAAAWAERLG